MMNTSTMTNAGQSAKGQGQESARLFLLSGKREEHLAQDNQVLLRETAHRVKNMLAVIQSIARQTLQSTPDPERFAECFLGRLSGYASTYDLLAESGWHGAEIRILIENQLRPLIGDARRLTVSGSEGFVSAGQASRLGMVLHELGVNATKHGSLAAENGHVEISWEARGSAFRFHWCERNGAPVEPRILGAGFGSKLIDVSVCDVERDFDPAGFSVSFTLK